MIIGASFRENLEFEPYESKIWWYPLHEMSHPAISPPPDAQSSISELRYRLVFTLLFLLDKLDPSAKSYHRLYLPPRHHSNQHCFQCFLII